MKLALSALAALLLCSFSAFASGNTDLEALYVGLCQPGSALEKQWDESERKETLGLRKEFQAFLANPEPVTRAMSAALTCKLDLSNELELLFTYAFTCELAGQVADKIIARGCRTGAGKQLRVERAYELCRPIGEKLRRMPNEPLN